MHSVEISSQAAEAFWSGPRTAGALIVAAMAVGLFAMLLVAAFGSARAAEAQFRDLEPAVGHVGSLRAMSFAWAVPMLLVLAGFIVLATELSEQGSKYIPVLAAVAFTIFTTAWVVEASFHAAVTTWAVGQVERGEPVPELFFQLKRWLNFYLQVIVNPLGLLALFGFAVASLRTAVLPPWASWTLIVYCGLVVFFPLPLLIAPAIVFFGITLLVLG